MNRESPFIDHDEENKSTYSDKQRHFNSLQLELQRLHHNMGEFNELINETSNQYKYIQNLAIMHGSLFMASNTVFGHENE